MLDLSGLFCPEVVLRVRMACDSLPPGSRLDIVSTDPLSAIDIPLFALKAGHRILDHQSGDGKHRFVLMLHGTSQGSPE